MRRISHQSHQKEGDKEAKSINKTENVQLSDSNVKKQRKTESKKALSPKQPDTTG